MRTLLALALIGAGTYIGLTVAPLSGGTLFGALLIGTGGVWGITHFARSSR